MVRYFINIEKTRAYRIDELMMSRADRVVKMFGANEEIECRLLCQKISIQEIKQIEARYVPCDLEEYQNVLKGILEIVTNAIPFNY